VSFTAISQIRLQCHARIAPIKTIISNSLELSMQIIEILSFKYHLKALKHMMYIIHSFREVLMSLLIDRDLKKIYKLTQLKTKMNED